MFKRPEQNPLTDLQKSMYITFNTDCGKIAMEYLQSITLNRILPSTASSNELYFLEGQRFLVKHLQSLSQYKK